MKHIASTVLIIAATLSTNAFGSRGVPQTNLSADQYIKINERQVLEYEKGVAQLENLYAELIKPMQKKTDLQNKIDSISIALKSVPMPYGSLSLAEGITLTEAENATIKALKDRGTKCWTMRTTIETKTKEFAEKKGLKYRTDIGPMY